MHRPVARLRHIHREECTRAQRQVLCGLHSQSLQLSLGQSVHLQVSKGGPAHSMVTDWRLVTKQLQVLDIRSAEAVDPQQGSVILESVHSDIQTMTGIASDEAMPAVPVPCTPTSSCARNTRTYAVKPIRLCRRGHILLYAKIHQASSGFTRASPPARLGFAQPQRPGRQKGDVAHVHKSTRLTHLEYTCMTARVRAGVIDSELDSGLRAPDLLPTLRT